MHRQCAQISEQGWTLQSLKDHQFILLRGGEEADHYDKHLIFTIALLDCTEATLV